jgi:DDE domain
MAASDAMFGVGERAPPTAGSSLSRLTWSLFIPPYSARQRKYVVSVTAIVFTASAIGNVDRQEVGRWLNNRAENSHQPFRRRERAMLRFRRMKTLQKFASVHASVHNHFNQERHHISREQYRERRSAALAEWRRVMA